MIFEEFPVSCFKNLSSKFDRVSNSFIAVMRVKKVFQVTIERSKRRVNSPRSPYAPRREQCNGWAQCARKVGRMGSSVGSVVG